MCAGFACAGFSVDAVIRAAHGVASQFVGRTPTPALAAAAATAPNHPTVPNRQEVCDEAGNCYPLSASTHELHGLLLGRHDRRDRVSLDEAPLVELPLRHGSSRASVSEEEAVALAAHPLAVAAACADAAGCQVRGPMGRRRRRRARGRG